jgi:3D (Asp-Asp-Asp) domain-containing protein
LKDYPILRGSAVIAFVLLTSSLIFSAKISSAETLSTQSQQQSQPAQPTTPVALDDSSRGTLGKSVAVQESYVVPPVSYVATAYSLRGRTASGRLVAKGLIAADPRHLPLGSRVRIEAGAYSGEYLVADTGSMVRGRRIDIWTPTSREAMRFGRRLVKLTVLSLGGKR